MNISTTSVMVRNKAEWKATYKKTSAEGFPRIRAIRQLHSPMLTKGGRRNFIITGVTSGPCFQRLNKYEKEKEMSMKCVSNGRKYHET